MNFSYKLAYLLQERFLLQVSTLSFNVIKNCFEELRDILRYVFDLILETGIFPDPLKIAKMTLVFKTGDLKAISSYCPSLFCRFFENIIVYYAQPPLQLFNKRKRIISKQFGF